MLTVAAVGAMALLIAGISSPEKIVDFIGFSSADFTFGIVKIPMNAVFFVLCGFFASVMWGAIFNLSVTGLGKYTAVASGIFMVMVCGGGVFPAIQSLIASNSIIASFWVPFCLAAYICIYALFLSRPKNTEGMPEEPEVLN